LTLAKADGPVYMKFEGVNGANDGQFYVSPYFGSMNGQQVALFCDDIINEVSFGQTWWATVTNLGSNDFSNTRSCSPLLPSPTCKRPGWSASSPPIPTIS